MLKGILHPDDARLAVEHGVEGVLVSNHGGRQVDGAKALLFRLARRRAFDPTATIKQLGADWEAAMDALDHLAVVARRGAA